MWLTAPVRKINPQASTVTFKVKREPPDGEPYNGFGDNGFGDNGFVNETVDKTVVLKTDFSSETDDSGARDANEDKSPASSSKDQLRGAPSGPEHSFMNRPRLPDEGDDDQNPGAWTATPRKLSTSTTRNSLRRVLS